MLTASNCGFIPICMSLYLSMFSISALTATSLNFNSRMRKKVLLTNKGGISRSHARLVALSYVKNFVFHCPDLNTFAVFNAAIVEG